MALKSLEWYCETVIIMLLASDVRTHSIPAVHHGPDEAAALGKFIVKATRGSRRLDGVGGWDVSVEVKYATKELTPEELDVVSDAIHDAVFKNTDAPDISAATPLSFLSIEDEVDTGREDGKKTRNRTVTFTMIANGGEILPEGFLENEIVVETELVVDEEETIIP